MKYIARLLQVILISILFSTGCASDKKELPNTPEKVSRQWQDWIDNNQYQEARELSTTNAIEWINWAEETIAASDETNEILAPAVFISMTCSEIGDKAICGYVMDDEGFEYRDSFYLQKIKGQWLVDIPEEDLIEEDGLKELFENLEKEREEVDS